MKCEKCGKKWRAKDARYLEEINTKTGLKKIFKVGPCCKSSR